MVISLICGSFSNAWPLTWSPPFSSCILTGRIMDKITIKTPNTKCRLYWCLTECIYCPSNLLTGSHPPPPVWISTGLCIYTVYNGEGGSGCVESIQRSYTRCILPDSEPTHCFTTPNKNQGGEGPRTYKQLPPSPFIGQLLRKADI